DDTGSEWTREDERFTFRLFPNRFVYSRDQNRASAPYLTVTLGPADRQPPGAPTGLKSEAAELPPGEAIVSWATPRALGPAGTLGSVPAPAAKAGPRELIPLAGPGGSRVEMHLRGLGPEGGSSHRLSVRAVDGAGNVGPAAEATVRLTADRAEPLPGRAWE